MKKILFMINSLTIGGSEKSLISLLSLLDYSKYEVDILMLKKGGEFEKYLPNQVNVLDIPRYYRYLNRDYKNIKRLDSFRYRVYKYKCSLALRINGKFSKTINGEQILYKCQSSILEKLSKKYDVAIAYSQGFPTYYIVDKVEAKKKVAWINCDYATTVYDKEFDYKYYKEIDKIIAVSKTVRDSIVNLQPEYEEKLEVILDIVNPDLINKMSNEKKVIESRSCYINILTVGRLVIHHKGYDLAVKAAKNLKDKGYKFKWYVVGEGPDRKKIEEIIKRNNLNNEFILLGKRDNPYPYMKRCDIYVQPSRKEGFGLTVVEAKILKKPIVCTNFNTAKELINNKIDGLIVDMDSKSISEGIERYIEDKKFYLSISKKLDKEESYSSTMEINKVNNLLEYN